MKSKSLRAVLSAVVVATVGAVALMAVAPASAATVPTPSASGGVVTICPGTDVNLSDPKTGVPLPLQEQQDLIDHFSKVCAGQAVPMHDAAVQGRAMRPNHFISGVGDLTAHLVITVGSVAWNATASSLASGYKKLYCTSRVNYGAWGDCGKDEGSGSSLSTRTNVICPPKGQKWEVEAWLNYNGSDYYDVASGTTK